MTRAAIICSQVWLVAWILDSSIPGLLLGALVWLVIAFIVWEPAKSEGAALAACAAALQRSAESMRSSWPDGAVVHLRVTDRHDSGVMERDGGER